MASPLLEDPRARDLLAAVPGDAEQLAATFRRAAGDAGVIGQGLAAAAGDALWQGAAADAFRRSISPLPGEMSRILDGYGAVAAALDGYAAELAELQSAFRALVPALEEEAAGPTPAAAAAAAGAAGADGAAAGAARHSALRARARQILAAFETAREDCRHRVAVAQATAPTQTGPRAPQPGARTVAPQSGAGETAVEFSRGRPR